MNLGRVVVPWVLGVVLALCAGSAAQAQFHYFDSPNDPRLTQKAVLGANEVELVSALMADSPPRLAARAVGRLRVQLRTPKGKALLTTCTGVLVSESLLLTAHHCIPGWFGVQVTAVWFELGEPNRGAGPKAYPVVVKARDGSQEMDFALLEAQGSPGARFGHAALSTRSAAQGEAVFIIHYPQGGPKSLSRVNCRIHRRSPSSFMHSCDTAWGSSGAPVFSDRTGKLLGLHTAGNRQANYGSQITALLRQSSVLAALLPEPAGVEAVAGLGIGESYPLPAEGNGLARSFVLLALREMGELSEPEAAALMPGALAAPMAELDLALWTDKAAGSIYREGQQLVVHARCDRDCHLKIVYVDAQGHGIVIFPNGFQQEGRVPAGQTVQIPGVGAPFTLGIHPPFGKERVYAFASNKPLPATRGRNAGYGLIRIAAPLDTFLKRQRSIAEEGRIGQAVQLAESQVEILTQKAAQ